jgi:hypothetical protein
MHCPQDQDWHLPPGSCHQTPFLEKPAGWFRQRWGLINKHEDLVWATRMGICDATVCWFYHIIHHISYIIYHTSYIISYIISSCIIHHISYPHFLLHVQLSGAFSGVTLMIFLGFGYLRAFLKVAPHSMLWTKRYSLDTAET